MANVPVYPEIFGMPFCYNGDKQSIPESTTASGKASLSKGFPPETSRSLDDDGIPPSRTDFNGILNLISSWAFYQQSGGIAKYNTTLNYIVPAQVFHNNIIYTCKANNGPNNGGVKVPGASGSENFWRVGFGDQDGSIAAINTAISNINSELTTINGKIKTNADNIAANKTAINTNKTNIATNATNIATNKANIAANKTAIDGHTTSITKINGDITNLTSSLKTATDNIAKNAAAIATNATNIANNKSAIATNKSNIAANKSSITTLQTNVGNLQTSVDGLNTNVTNITNKISSVGKITVSSAAASGTGVANQLWFQYI